MPVRRPGRRARVAAVLALAAGLVAACSGGSGGGSVSVFSVAAGQCFTTPSSVKVQLSDLNRVSCTKPHTEEAYAKVRYRAPAQSGPSASAVNTSAYPGATMLESFAKGACAQDFAGYVGVDYLDSSLYFTYLLPSARSWEERDDRSVLCFVTTTGSKLSSSVRNSKK